MNFQPILPILTPGFIRTTVKPLCFYKDVFQENRCLIAEEQHIPSLISPCEAYKVLLLKLSLGVVSVKDSTLYSVGTRNTIYITELMGY